MVRDSETMGASDSSAAAAVLEGGGNAAASAATLQAQKTVEAHRKRGRPPGSGKQSSPTKPTHSRAAVEQSQAEMAKALEALYAPENWEGIVKAPADILLAFTGDEIWDLPQREIKVLASQASAAGRYFLATDPKWVALTLFAFTVATSYGSRAAIYFRKKKIATND